MDFTEMCKNYQVKFIDLMKGGNQLILWVFNELWGPLWLWSYGSWIYNYLCNQRLSPLTLWVRTSLRRVCQWLEAGRWFSPGTPVSSINKTDHYNITEIFVECGIKHHKLKNKPNELWIVNKPSFCLAFLLMLSGETANTIFIVFVLTWLRINLVHTQSVQVYYYTWPGLL